MRRKAIISIAAAAVMLMTAGIPVLAGWEQTEGIWAYKENGQNVANTWKQINGKWYYFDHAGKMQSGWLETGGKWYYLDPVNGDMKEGWISDNGNWYFLNETSGEMATGWTQAGEKWYFMDNSGTMQTGIIEVDGKIYALDETDGDMKTGLVLLKTTSYDVYKFDSVTGEAIGDKIPTPTKAYSQDGKKQEGLSAVVREQIKKQEEKKREEEKASSNTNDDDLVWNRPGRPGDSSEDITVTDVKIQEITVPESGKVDVVLSKAVELDIADFYISCPAGKDMTILKVETEQGIQKNRVYHITTAHFDDNTYMMEITLSNGKRIEKSFVTSLSAPGLKEIEARRTAANTATISLIADDAGMLYYIAVPTNTAAQGLRMLAGQAIGQNVPQTGQEVQKYGESMRLDKQGLYDFSIEGLKENQAYTVYFATAQEEGKTAVLRGSVSVAGQPESGNTGDIAIEEADAVSNSKIKLVFNKATQEELTLADIHVECAKGPVNIGGIATEDQKTYTISMQANWFMNSKTGYTVYVTMPDGSKLEKKFYTDFDYPNLNQKEAKRIAEDEIEVTFRSDEGGVLYYGSTENTDKDMLPSADEIVKNAPKEVLSGGLNRLRIKINKNDKLFYLVPVDQKGNRPPRFAETIVIPDEIEAPGTDQAEEIENITYTTNSIGYHKLTVTMKDPFDILAVEKEEITIYPLDGQGLATEPKITGRGGIYFDQPNVFYLEYNIKFPEGRYELGFSYNGIYYSKVFEIK